MIIFVVLFFLIAISNDINSTVTTGETITSKATNGVGMNITILAAPSLNILSPENGTYITNQSLLLNYSVSSDATKVWYSLDGITNVTITSSILFNASEGSHSLFLYANNSIGYNATKNVSFSINVTKFSISGSKYNGTLKGNSTNFMSYTYEKLQNLSNVTLENTNFGKILFNQNINLTNVINNLLDLDNNTNISFNRIEINSTALSDLNRSATLQLYGLTFTNPRILRDGSVCSSAICTQESYSGGTLKTLKFNVTGFTTYSAEETPAGLGGDLGGGGTTGGGAGGAVTTKQKFTLNKDEIITKSQQGRLTTEEIIITNNENTGLDVEINVSKIEGFVFIREKSFHLNPKEIKLITINIVIPENTVPNLYIGEIKISAGGQEKKILTAIEVESSPPLFDITVKIPEKFSYVIPGEEVMAEIEIYNLGEVNKEVDAHVEYRILDSQGNEILSEQESLAVNTKINYIKEFRIPLEAKFGRYAIYIKTTYDSKIASSSVWFNVGRVPSFPQQTAIVALLIVIIIALIILIITIRKIKKEKPLNKRVDEKFLKRANIIKKRQK